MDSMDIQTMSKEDIFSRAGKREHLSDPSHPFAGENVLVITPNTLGMFCENLGTNGEGEPSEAIALRIVAQHTTIPVPRVLRIVGLGGSDSLMIIERIPGKQLSVVWSTMSDTEKENVANTLRGYIQQLREIDVPRRAIPGPLGNDDSPLSCYSSPIFGNIRPYRGPFATCDDLSMLFETRVRIANNKRRRDNSPEEVPSYESVAKMCPNGSKLVLVHQDLNPRNLILGDDGRLWVIDWTWSGFYPAWWEGVAMKAQARNEELVWKRKNPSWDRIIPVVCGEFKKLEDWHWSVAGSWYSL